MVISEVMSDCEFPSEDMMVVIVIGTRHVWSIPKATSFMLRSLLRASWACLEDSRVLSTFSSSTWALFPLRLSSYSWSSPSPTFICCMYFLMLSFSFTRFLSTRSFTCKVSLIFLLEVGTKLLFSMLLHQSESENHDFWSLFHLMDTGNNL